VAALVKAAPFSIQAATQFGELPLHLAVEMGATPEVINLLLVNFYPAIHIEDNSGRTPMQIILEADAFNIDDAQIHSRIVEECAYQSFEH
jgi:ankyrin repeat protein